MSPIYGLRRFFRIDRGARHIERDVDDELRFHFEMAIRDLTSCGVSGDDALREATRRFGSVRRTRAQLRRIDRQREGARRRAEWWDALLQDVRYAARGVRRMPGFAGMVAATLGLGIGANALMFSIIDRLLLSGPEYVVAPSRVQRVYISEWQSGSGVAMHSGAGFVTYADLRDGARTLERVAAYSAGEATIGRGASARTIHVVYVTWDFFALTGVRPARGRFFGLDEDRPPRGERVIVLDERFWRREYAGDTTILGHTVAIDGTAFTVVGIAPRGFTGVTLERVDAWMPMSIVSANVVADWPRSRNAQWLRIIARLRPGISPDHASKDATAAHRRAATGAAKEIAEASIVLRPLSAGRGGGESREVVVSRWLAGVAAIVLGIACANVTNLLLARVVRRRREIGVRLALGIGRARLLRLLLIEALMLAAIGGALALLVVYWGSRLVRDLLLPDVVWSAAPLNLRVLGVTALVTLGVGLLVALLPALQAMRGDLTRVLKMGSREGGGTHRSTVRRTLTIAQTALSVVLLVGAGLFVRSLRTVRSLQLGVEPSRVLVTDVAWPRLGALPRAVADAERRRHVEFFDRALARLRELPSIEHAAVAVGSPFGSTFTVDLRVPGIDSIPQLEGGGPYISAITGDFFSAVGTRLLRGRSFEAGEGATTEPVAIVNATMAATLWPAKEAIGQCLVIGDLAERPPCSRVVGVVEDARRWELREPRAMQYYVPLGQERGIGGRVLFVRPRCGPSTKACDTRAMVEPLRRELLTLSPHLPYVFIQTMQQIVDPQARPWTLGATLFGAFGALALVVAALGLFSVMAYLVVQRTHELGVRAALGARATQVAGVVLREGVVSTATGLVIGVAIALAGGRFIRPVLFETSPYHPAVFVTVTLTLLAVATVACLVPAVRASHIDPLIALREE